jgi:protein-S-isoprenylcysteine O-methyltransferase Ste14
MARWSLAPGAVVAFVGLALRVWATGWLQKNSALATAGPYGLCRNPLYLGTWLLVVGQSLMSSLPLAPVLVPALVLALYWPTMRDEERHLRALFGATYENYRSRVPLLLPRPGAPAGPL